MVVLLCHAVHAGPQH
uniref:Uncharacterized protein n=1 Tax=Arundo donax TaxID=35708 RepID=A0A0A9FAX8_ARUDO